MGLSPVKLGLDLRGGVYLVYQVDIQGAVKQLLDRHEQDFRASLRNAKVPYKDVVVDYPDNKVRVLFRDADSFAKGKAAILADNRNLNFTDVTVGGEPALELQLTPQEIKERQDLRRSAKHRHPAQSPQQSGTGRLRAAGRPGGRRSHRHPAAGTAELRRGEEDPRQNGDLGIPHGR